MLKKCREVSRLFFLAEGAFFCYNGNMRLTDIHCPELDIYARLLENQLRRIYEPKEGLFVAESPVVVERALAAGYEPVSFLLEEKEAENEKIAEMIRAYKDTVPVYTADTDTLRQIPGFNLTRGLLCAMKRKPLPKAEEICRDARRICVLENVQNPTNVGAIIRSAAALGMDAVLLTAGSSDPLYRRAARVSVGTVFQVPWTFIPDVQAVRNLGFKTVSMALRKNSVELTDEKLKKEERLAILMGSEETGLSDQTIEESDYVVKIPMDHGVDSLNVAAASAVAFWELCKADR